MDLPPLDNQTDFIVHPQLLLHKDGEHLVAMVKSTWELPRGAGKLELAPEDRQRGLRPAAISWGEPAETSVLFPGDLCVRKPGTDVVVVARGFAPHGKPTERFDVSVRVGPLSKVLRVFGLRVWSDDGLGMSDPRPISELDLRYEYAWGGAQLSDEGEGVEEGRNPVGRGMVIDKSSLTHEVAPQLEDPFDLVTSADSRPAPAGFGAIARHWQPRRGYAGTYDDAWLDSRAPLPPKDEDDRVNNVASPGLWAETPLRGDEEVALANTTPKGGSVKFRLPAVGVEIRFEQKGQKPQIFVPALDTVLIDQLFGPDVGWPVVELVWRAAIVAPRRMKDAKIVVRERTLS